MGYSTSNAAYAYDMRSEAYSAPVAPSRPSLDVVHGAGRQASQDVSPQFTHCVKVFAVLMTVFVVLGLFRVTVAGFTAASLNSAATLSNNLTTAQEESSISRSCAPCTAPPRASAILRRGTAWLRLRVA